MSIAVIDRPSLPASSQSSQEDNTYDERAVRKAHQLASEQVRLDTIEAMLALPAQYRQPNWNGEGALPIADTAIEEARLFLEKLPETIPWPEVIAEPDGNETEEASPLNARAAGLDHCLVRIEVSPG